MGTRGFITFAADGVEKTGYNQFDSYPEGLGVAVLEWLHIAVKDVEGLTKAVRALRVVDADSTPTDDDIARLQHYADLRVSTRSLDEWYVLLRKTQGIPAAILEAGVIEDAGDFPCDSLFAEWGYVVDLDAQVFEVYRGFQTTRHHKGRFADREPAERPWSALDTTYYPVALIKQYPLAALPSAGVFEIDLLEEDRP